MFRRSPAAASQPSSGTDPADAIDVGLVIYDKTAQAIKLYRELTTLDLKTTKDVIDSL